MINTIVPELPGAVRLMRLNPGLLQPNNPVAFDKALGAAIERTRVLGATTVVVDAAVTGAEGRLEVWFPNRELPVKADVLSRIVWQMHSKAHIEIAVSLPLTAARATLKDDSAVVRLFEDLGADAPADALLIDQAPALAAIRVDPSSSMMRWEVRRRRSTLDPQRLPATDALALQAFSAFERMRPKDRLFLLSTSVDNTPSAVADLTLVEAPLAAKPFARLIDRMTAGGWFAPDLRYRWGVWIRAEKPPSAESLSANVRLFQRRGGIAFGWEPDDPVTDQPKAAKAAPSVSAAGFPFRRKP